MRIALISYEYPPDTAVGGIATYVGEVAAALSGRGHLVEVFCGTAKATYQVESGGLVVHRIKVGNRSDFGGSVVNVFKDRYERYGFDVIESPDYGADGLEVMRSFPMIPHLVKLHTPSRLVREISRIKPNLTGWLRAQKGQLLVALGCIRRGKLPPAYRFFFPLDEKPTPVEFKEKEAALMADWVVSPSNSLRDWAVREWGVQISNSEVVPYPYRSKPELVALTSNLENRCVGFFGRLEERKGMSTLLAAIPVVLKQRPDIRFRFVGSPQVGGPSLERYDRYISRKLSRFKENIEFVGSKSPGQMADEYSKVDVCVFPSLWENFPNVCLESMAAARAIVASQEGGMADMLQDRVNGRLLDPRDPIRWAEVILELMSDRPQRHRLAASARMRFLTVYAGDDVVEKIEKSYAHAVRMNALIKSRQ